MKLSRKLKTKIKRKTLQTLTSVALVTTTLAVFKLADISVPLEKIKNNKLFRDNETVLISTEKEKNVENFSNSSYLNNIYIGESKIQGFESNKLNYEVIFANELEEIEINVDKQDEGQVVTGIGTIALTGEEQIIEINVTSKDTSSSSTYTITISYTQKVENKNIYEFKYTGDYQEFEAPYTGYYKMECWGAQGGSYSGTGGKGAYNSGNIYLKKGQKVYIYVGQTGGSLQTATYNGGGASGTLYYGRSGGGATDIRLSAGNWDDFESLKSRIMVAAGGGGSMGPSYACNGGAGGALSGINGSKGGSGGGYTVAGGATQTSGGTAGTGAVTAKASGFGFGGSGNADHGGGGRRRLLWRWPEAAIIVVL